MYGQARDSGIAPEDLTHGVWDYIFLRGWVGGWWISGVLPKACLSADPKSCCQAMSSMC